MAGTVTTMAAAHSEKDEERRDTQTDQPHHDVVGEEPGGSKEGRQ
jgi:hypothetical protein